MDCVSIQQREFPACRPRVSRPGDHLVGHRRRARDQLWCEQAAEENNGAVWETCPHCLGRLSWHISFLCNMALRLTQALLCIPFSHHGRILKFASWRYSSHIESTQNMLFGSVACFEKRSDGEAAITKMIQAEATNQGAEMR